MLFLIYPVSVSSALTDSNLVANPGFENGGTTPSSWTFVTNRENTPFWDIISHSGARSIRVQIGGTRNKISGYPKSDLISAQPLSNYTLSAWGKTKNTGGNAPAVRVVELDANKILLTTNILYFSIGSYEWAQKQIDFRTGSNTAYLYIYANILNGYGTFWVDDLNLSLKAGPVPTPTPTHIPTPTPTSEPAPITESNSSVSVDISITKPKLDAFKFNWNGTNYSFYDSSLILAMNFNDNPAIGETTTKSVDISKYRNDGTINGATWKADGKFNGALQFDGVNDYVMTPAFALSGDALSFEFWSKTKTRTSDQAFITQGESLAGTIYIFRDSYDNLNFEYSNGVQSYKKVFNEDFFSGYDNLWIHTAIIVNYTTKEINYYRNSILVNITKISETMVFPKNIAVKYIGSYKGMEQSLGGSIDELRIWNRTLTPSEIKMHYQSEFQKVNSTDYKFYNNISWCNCSMTNYDNNLNPAGNGIGGGSGYSNIISPSQADYLVSDRITLLNALDKAKSGDIIYVNDNAEIDLTTDSNIIIPAGVTLASGRGNGNSKGALLYSNYLKYTGGNEVDYQLFIAGGNGVRITGLRINGSDTMLGKYAYDYSVSFGIYSEYNIEVDNNEISGWSHCAVCIYNQPSKSIPTIHNNYIHNNIRDDLGYGVGVCYGSNAIIEANLFDWNRHSIMGDGRVNTSYIARYNKVLNNGIGHGFDMHGGKDIGDGTDRAGKTVNIYGNTFEEIKTAKGYMKAAIVIRGVPTDKADIYNNYFYYKSESESIEQINAFGNMNVHNNCFNGFADYLPAGTYTYFDWSRNTDGSSSMSGTRTIKIK